jgi:hypothetical protein
VSELASLDQQRATATYTTHLRRRIRAQRLPDRSLKLDGVFVSTSAGPAKQQVGVFTASGPNSYQAVGAFLVTR